MQDNFFFRMVCVSGTYSEKFAQIDRDRFQQYKLFYGLLDVHVFVNYSQVKTEVI